MRQARGQAFGIVVGSLVAAALSSSRAAASVCPTNEMAFKGMPPFYSTASSFDSTYVSFGTSRVAYDLVVGSIAIRHCCSLGTTYVQASDAYDVTGVAPGTPVTLTAELVVDGAVFDGGSCGGSGCAGLFADRIQHGADIDQREHWANLFYGARAEYHDVLRVPVTIVAGQPETIVYRFWSTRAPGGSHGGEGTGVVRFTGLDPGVSVVSCQGYAGAVVPVRSSSWGRVKAIYR